jgi:uncharacterized LabA/DUF88 family protein
MLHPAAALLRRVVRPAAYNWTKHCFRPPETFIPATRQSPRRGQGCFQPTTRSFQSNKRLLPYAGCCSLERKEHCFAPTAMVLPLGGLPWFVRRRRASLARECSVGPEAFCSERWFAIAMGVGINRVRATAMSPESRSSPSTPLPTSPPALPQGEVVVRVFVDFWNFHLAMNRWRPRFRFDWSRLGASFAHEVEMLRSASGSPGRIHYGGLHLYISYNPGAPQDEGLRRWARNVLNRFEGIHVVLKARRPKELPNCPGCHAPIAVCPRCSASMQRTTEKGMDTAIVTDMVRLAWEGCWDVAVLVSADGDFVPAVEHLQRKGHMVVHAGFAPHRSALARACRTSFDMAGVLRSIERPGNDCERARETGGSATTRARCVLTEKENRKKVCPLLRKTDPCGD